VIVVHHAPFVVEAVDMVLSMQGFTASGRDVLPLESVA